MTVSVSAGEISADGGIEIENSTVSLSGTGDLWVNGQFVGEDVDITGAGTSRFESSTFTLEGLDASTVTLEDSAEFAVSELMQIGNINPGDDITIDIYDSAVMSCEWLKLDECELTIGGTLDIAGSTSITEYSRAGLSSISILGGTFEIAGGFFGNVDLTINGTLKVLQSTNGDHVFSNSGFSQFLGGSIQVKQGEKVTLN